MLVWAEDEAGALAIEEAVRHYWLSDDGDERGARDNRINVKRMIKGGAAGYVAKYIAKSVGHLALAQHQDIVNGEQVAMDFGDADEDDVQESGEGHRRVDAWAATWGLRQFQAFGMPSVTVWRELRRVTEDQLELFDCEDHKVRRAYTACHRRGELRADWREFMEAMGGYALPRCRWHIRTAHRTVRPGDVNQYGEAVKVGRLVGVVPQCGRMAGRWLVSRFIRWSPVAQSQAADASAAAGAEGAGADSAVQAQGQDKATARAALPRAWTGFNNCTRRTFTLLKALSGRRNNGSDGWPPTDPGTGEPHAEAWH